MRNKNKSDKEERAEKHEDLLIIIMVMIKDKHDVCVASREM